MTAQEYYDKVITALVERKLPARSDDNDGCRYRTEDGRQCMVGLAMPDEIYAPSLEGLMLSSLSDEVVKACIPEGMTEEDMATLQRMHDGVSGEVPKAEEFCKVFFPVFNAYMRGKVLLIFVGSFKAYQEKFAKEEVNATQSQG